MIQLLETPAIRHAVLPISVQQYHRLSAAGIIPERTELLQGLILEKMTKSPLHVYLVQWLVGRLQAVLPAGVYLRKEEPLTLSDSEPEPDVAVVEGGPDDYRREHPNAALLVVEVAIATLDLDRKKGPIYAAAGVAEYWIVAPEAGVVELHTDPAPSGYRSSRHFLASDDSISSTVLPGFSLAPSELLTKTS